MAAKTGAQRQREFRARRRMEAGTTDVVLFGEGNQAARRHGGWARDVDASVLERLADPALPDYVRLPAFAEAAAVALRTVERAGRIGRYVAAMTEAESITPVKAGSSSPADIARLHDDSALRALGTLGLTPASAVKFGRRLDQSGRPDVALMAMEQQAADGRAGRDPRARWEADDDGEDD